jgi:transcriptional regulator with GAF, ATPase, and Fis domain
MSNTLDENPQALVNDNKQPQESSPTRRVAADQSDLELTERSQAFIKIMKQVEGVADSNLPVLLIGALGTGKQLVACAIHQRSARSDHPLLAVNCATIPPDLIDAKLFGADPPDPDRRGVWELADGGTLFLDEITETDSSLQSKLLRALQTGEIIPRGTDETKHFDVRVIAASSRDLGQEVALGRFSEELFHALRTLSIVLPPLRKSQLKDANQARDQAAEEWVTLSEVEGRYVARVLNHTGGNKQAAARVLSVDRKTLDRMIKRHNIVCPHTRQRAKASVSS